MAKLGKWVTAAGGVLVAVFSLVALIVVAATETSKFGPGFSLGVMVSGGLKALAIIEGLLLVALGAGLAVGAVLMYDRLNKCLAWTAGSVVVLLVVTVLPFKLFAMIGALAALAGAKWDCCCGEVCGGETEAATAQTPDAPAAPAQQPPESRL